MSPLHRAHGQVTPPRLSKRYPPSAALNVALPSAAIAWYDEIDLATVEDCRRSVADALVEGISEVALDLRAVTFLDSSGLAVISGLLRRCGEAGASLVLVAPQPSVVTTLRMTGFLGAVEVRDATELAGPLRALLPEAG